MDLLRVELEIRTEFHVFSSRCVPGLTCNSGQDDCSPLSHQEQRWALPASGNRTAIGIKQGREGQERLPGEGDMEPSPQERQELAGETLRKMLQAEGTAQEKALHCSPGTEALQSARWGQVQGKDGLVYRGGDSKSHPPWSRQ